MYARVLRVITHIYQYNCACMSVYITLTVCIGVQGVHEPHLKALPSILLSDSTHTDRSIISSSDRLSV